jgi:hypothetical protein
MRGMRMRSRSQARIARCWVPARALLAALLACLLAAALSAPARGEAKWTTYHRDPARSGVDPEAGAAVTPALAWKSASLGAPIYGQPLVLGARVYVATVGDRIYALEAASGKVIWEKSAGAPVPSGELPCGDITPTVGIVGTPVIDPATGAIYAVADTWDASKKEARHTLKGYALSGGEEVLSKPVDPPGADPKAQLQRTALNLDQGSVIFGFGGNDGDCSDYRGMVVSVPESGGAPAYWIYTPAPPATSGGAVWGASGPAVDAEGHIYASTGNPVTGKAQTYDYSDSVIGLEPNLSLSGYFKPESWLVDSNHDTDLGSAGPELLPGGVLFQSGKNDIGYLIGEAGLASGAPALYSHRVCGGAGSFGGDAFANGTIYVPCADGTRALAYNQAAHTFSELWQGPTEATGSPILSAGLVWVPATKFGGGSGSTLYGLELSTGKVAYTLTLPSAVEDHFASPSAAAGRLFLATGESVSAYRIAQPAPAVGAGAAASITQTSASLSASVNPNGFPVSECRFEYGTTTAYGKSATCTPAPGSGESPVAVSASVSALSPSTAYHFRISATNAGGTSLGEDTSFTTQPSAPPPTVATTAATSVTRTLATVNGTVNPNSGNVTECNFEYGTTASYGSTAPCSSLPGSGTSPVAATAPVGNLSPATTYHFRISATNAGGTSPGSDQTFTTLTALPTPHWYKNSVKVPLGEKWWLIGWGTLTLESSAGTATCHSAQVASVENTAGAARKEVVLFVTWECKPIGGSCTGGEQRATPKHLPWMGTMLEEGVEGAGEFREEGWGIELNLECFKGGVNTSNMLFKTGPVLAETATSTPRWLNGTSATKPSEASFDLSSGHLYAEVEKAAVKGTTKGKLKFLGYQDNAPVPLITIAKP